MVYFFVDAIHTGGVQINVLPHFLRFNSSFRQQLNSHTDLKSKFSSREFQPLLD